MSRYFSITGLAVAVAVATTAAPVLAETSTDTAANAHHYQGGPQTAVPHNTRHPQAVSAANSVNTGHHYSGGPKTEAHHMGEMK